MKQWIFIALILCFVINGCDGYQANLGKLVRKWKVADEIDECIPDDSDQCTVPGNWSSTQVCSYVKCNDDNCEGGGYLLWTRYVECASNPTVRILLIIVGVIYMLFLFIMVSSAADDFFSPSISSIVAHLRISESVAGVTFMAFGNGAPDVFGAIASVLSSPTPKADLALGELFGAGLFVTTMVLAVTIFTRPFKAEVFSSIRDIVFYLIALSFLALCFVFYDHVELWMPICELLFEVSLQYNNISAFLGIYLIYVCTVILSQILHNRQKREREETIVKSVDVISVISLDDDEDIYISHGHHILHAHEVQKIEAAIETAEILKTWSFGGIVGDLKEHLKPWPNGEDWKEMNVFQKAICIVNIIPTFLFKLTIPHNEQPWSKPISLLHCLICPVFLLFCIQVCSISPFPNSPGLWLYGLILSALLIVIVSVFTELHKEPEFYKVNFSFNLQNSFFNQGITSYAGFIMSIAWIYLISSEVVNVVTMLGVVSRVSHEVLGLTILAWSNSIGDLIADVSVAKQGYPVMAMAAAIGGQLFNLLIGFGLPFTIAKIQGKSISMIINPTYRLLMLFLGISLVFTLIAMFAQKFFLRRIHSYSLVFIYIAFFVFIGLSLDGILVWN
ncbi:CRE-NCX-6 protein [Caenorhabditis remanei]|uniref:CRE-NCX-6 protein n=1 Tax=Caenorhabditis remanei TaxID=31234 RepID=E3LS95_CAERE|nr:CRE-NCX-6 protein [Caenorhabditis remanei]